MCACFQAAVATASAPRADRGAEVQRYDAIISGSGSADGDSIRGGGPIEFESDATRSALLPVVQ